MESKTDEIIFTSEDGEKVVFQVIEQTRLGGTNYLLVTTSQDEDEAEALILKDISEETEEEAIYNIVEDDDELESVARIFKELLDDIQLL
ncbi:MAG: DUF1292 domain-containing protein [Clostridiales bacterium]|nr:DUF1292 domain-containing protein [Clostridiales bacterium]